MTKKQLAYHKAYREANRERIRANHRKWEETHREQESIRQKAHFAANKEWIVAARRIERKLNPERYKARNKVNNSLRLGYIHKLPCEICGELKVEAHHDDYSKPLEVRWLCRKHHGEQLRNDNKKENI